MTPLSSDRPWHGLIAAFACLALAAGLASGQDGGFAQAAEAVTASPGATAPAEVTPTFTVNNLWICIAAALVFIMHLGFATLETGLTRAKNSVNILFKNTGIVAVGLLTYAIVGFNLMYPGSFNLLGPEEGGVLGFAGFGVGTNAAGLTPAYDEGYTYWGDFIFQAMFAATAATIVSGAVAERIKLLPFLAFSTVYVALIYPVFGSWQWGEGWLSEGGFHDFAGSTIVHSVGGWGALAGVIMLGPRLGKYITIDGKPAIRPIIGHNLPLAAIGVFLLWFGWFGFNGGSVLSADPAGVSYVFTTTALAAAGGIVGAMVTSWIVQSKPDLTMALNGALAGLVGITAGADVIPVAMAVLVGAVAGVIVVFSVIGLDRLKLDDPVGAISVHLICGVWGTLAVGLFAEGTDLLWQVYGILAAAGLCFPAALLIFAALKFSPLGLRVSRDEELGGLDIGEHGMEAYGGFQVFPDM